MLYLALHRNGIAPSPDPDPTTSEKHSVQSGNDLQWRILDVFVLLGEFLCSKRKAAGDSGKLVAMKGEAMDGCIHYLALRMYEFVKVEATRGVSLDVTNYICAKDHPCFYPIVIKTFAAQGKK
jgi:hypothetical protein